MLAPSRRSSPDACSSLCFHPYSPSAATVRRLLSRAGVCVPGRRRAQEVRVMHRKLGLIGILLGLSIAFGATSAWAQAQAGSIFVKAVDRAGCRRTRRHRDRHRPGSSAAAHRRYRLHRCASLPDAVGGHVFRQGHARRLPDRQPRRRRRGPESDRHPRLRPQGELAVRGNHRQGRDARGRHEERDRGDVNLDSKLLENTPGGKDIWNILEYKVPGLIFDTPDVGGNQAGLQRGFTARGTPNGRTSSF